MKKKKRKILLFLDPIQNVKVECFSVNTTAEFQPMNQGIIQNFKFHYRKEIIVIF